jgi:hypothetical protein
MSYLSSGTTNRSLNTTMKNKPQPDPSLVETVEIPDRTGPTHLTESQAQALPHLVAMARLHGHRETYGGYRVRTKPLLYGASGSGKTALCSRLADTLGDGGKPHPLLSVNTGSWIVFGARAEPATLLVLRAFVRRNPHGGIVLLDELDKALPSGGEAWTHHWALSVITELLAFLDTDDRLLTAGWSRGDVERLSTRFLIIGAGAWQRQSRKAAEDKTSHAAAIMADLGIPEEISLRFNSRFIEIAAPTPKDFHAAYLRVYSDLGIQVPAPDLEALVTSSVASRTGMRAVEQHLTDLLSAHPQLRRQTSTPVKPPEQEKATVCRAHVVAEKDNFHRLLEAAEVPLMQLKLHIGQLAPRLWPDADEHLLDLDGTRMTPEKFDRFCDEVLHGCLYRYAMDGDDRRKRETALWVSGNQILQVLKGVLKDRSMFRGCEYLLPVFSNATVRLSRLLAALEYLSGLVISDDSP